MGLIFTNSKLRRLITHFVGNKYNNDTFFYSKQQVDTSQDELRDLVLNYFTSPFRKTEEFYCFRHESDLNLNPMMHYANQMFGDVEKFIGQSINIAKHLYEITDTPNIKNGELHIVYLGNIEVDDEITDAIGIVKTEILESFFKLNKVNDAYQIHVDKGISSENIDKACLILNTNKEQGYQICIVDKTNKGEEAIYWKDKFLKVIQSADNYHTTQNYLDVCKHFVTGQLEQEYEVNKTDKIDFLNKTVEYFKANEAFDETKFLNQVFQDKDVITSFKNFKEEYTTENGIELNNDFEISNSAVKRQARVFKSVLKLDKNFHVYIHGDKSLIEKGYDSVVGKSYYKIYFDEES